MKNFEHFDVQTVPEAVELLKDSEGKARLIAGGTDLLATLKRELLPDYPEKLINIKTIEGLDYIKEDAEGLAIGATAKLTEITKNPIVKEKYPALAEAAHSVATPLVRNIATIGGNLCQEVRCWYYRYPNSVGGRIECLRKGGKVCNAMTGESRYHSVFGGSKVNLTPCTLGCPAGTDIPGYAERLRANDPDGAADILMNVNPFPAITSRVCGHFCQEHCNRGDYDESVNISSMERYVGDYVLEHTDRFYAAPENKTGKHVAIIGAGPAGLTAAFFLRRAGHEVCVYDKMAEAGGLLRYAIPDYRLPKEIVRRTIKAFEGMGIKFAMNTEIGRDVQLEELIEKNDSVFVNTGAWKRPLIGLNGEELTTFGLDFLIEVNKWLRDKIENDVIVVGGGNVAVDVAVTAKRMGAGHVRMACLESLEEMPASKEELARAVEEGIEIMPSWGSAKVLRDGENITGLRLKRCVHVFDENGHFAPCYDENETKDITGGSILMAVGQTTDLSFLDEKMQIEVNRGRITVDEKTQETTLPKVFALGDVVTGPKTVVSAMASGKQAAAAAEKYLTGKALPEKQVNREVLKFNPTCLDHSKPIVLPQKPKEERTLHTEDSSSATPEQIAAEAARCFNCGCIAVNPSDIAAVLVAMNAVIKTTKREVRAEEMFRGGCCSYIEPDEIVLEVRVPASDDVIFYDKFRVRESHDFAVVSVAAAYKMDGNVIKSARIVLGACAPSPMRATAAEEYLAGKTPSEEVAHKAAELALEGAIPLKENNYKIQIAKTLVERSVCKAVK